MKVRIVEVGSQRISFQKFDKTKKRPYRIRTSEILLIKYQNGTKDVIRTGPETQYDRCMRLANSRIRKGIAITCVGATLFSGGAVLAGFGIDWSQPKNGASMEGFTMALLGFVFAAGSIPPLIIGSYKISTAKRMQRTANMLKPELSFSPLLLPAGQAWVFLPGVGCSLRF